MTKLAKLSMRCPHCDASPGKPCRGFDGYPVAETHEARKLPSETLFGMLGGQKKQITGGGGFVNPYTRYLLRMNVLAYDANGVILDRGERVWSGVLRVAIFGRRRLVQKLRRKRRTS